MKTFISLYTVISLFFISVLLPSFGGAGGGLYAQNPELFEHTWFLTKVTIDEIDYIPSDYGFFPTLQLTEINGIYELLIADPLYILCSTEIDNFQTNPNIFTIIEQNWLCLTDYTCANPHNPEDPCTIIYENHAQIYYETNSLLTYVIEVNSDEIYTLEIVNTEGNQAFYSSEFLSIESFKINEIILYPNPTNNILYINKKYKQSAQAIIYDLSGKPVQSFFLSTTQTEIDVKALNPGLYFVVFEGENGEQVSKKFIKQ